MKKEAKDPNNITKKSSTLTIENVQYFLRNSEDSFSNLVVKVGIIVGVYGGMRISEIIALNFEDVKYDQGKYEVIIKCSKADPQGKGHSFLINPQPENTICPCHWISKYINCFEVKTGRFLRKILNSGKLSLPVGINTVAKYPKIVADFCGLEGSFTGHAMRRSSATILADSGASIVQLKRFGRWKSSSVAEEYVDESSKSKIEVADMIGGKVAKFDSTLEASSSTTNINLQGNFNNCQIIIHK